MPSVPGNAFHMISFIYSSHKNLQRNYLSQLSPINRYGEVRFNKPPHYFPKAQLLCGKTEILN